MRLLVVGASGFLGRRFAQLAEAEGHDVLKVQRRGNGPGLLTGDLMDSHLIAQAITGREVLVFLAAAGVQARDRTWSNCALTNITLPLRWAEEAARQNLPMVFAGTCLEYEGHGIVGVDSAPDDAAVCSTGSPLSFSGAYGGTKAAGGQLLMGLAQATSASVLYLRFASLYGPTDDGHKLLPSALRAARSREPFAMSAGAQVREWLHVDDACRALLNACERREPGARVLNVGTGVGLRLVEVVREVFRAAGADEALIQTGALPYRGREPHRLVMDVRDAEEQLRWRPSWSLPEGVRQWLRAER